MQILSFDIKGKFAHFRKFHGNNTALSYSIPPRTSIIGMLAALLGEGKDSYYEEFNSDHLKIGIRVLSDLKKSFHRLNFLKIIGKEDFSGRQGHIQTPFELVTGQNLRKHSVIYRIYLSPGEDDVVFERLKNQLQQKKYHYNITLGIANFSGFVSNFNLFEKVEEKQVKNEWIDIHSVCNSEEVLDIDFPDNPELKFNQVEEELTPADFVGNYNREVYRMNRLLFSICNFPIRVKLNGTYYRVVRENGEKENIQFMKYAGILPQQEK